MSSYKGQNIFGSGPHRFSVGEQGQTIVSLIQQGGWVAGTVPVGLRELDVIVRGRLVAASESVLWSLRDAVVAMLQETPTAGTLVDDTGRSWATMSFIRYAEDDRRDRGRVWSVAYEAVFRRFRT